LSLLIRVDDFSFPVPTLNAHDTRAPYMFPFSVTADAVSSVMACWKR